MMANALSRGAAWGSCLSTGPNVVQGKHARNGACPRLRASLIRHASGPAALRCSEDLVGRAESYRSALRNVARAAQRLGYIEWVIEA
jgi:hypothetical protein